MKKVGIYRIFNLESGKSYIGQSVDIDRRIKYHFKKLKEGKHFNRHLQNAYSLSLSSSFSFSILEECPRDSLTQREQYWMDYFADRFGLYNLAPAANSTAGVKFSKETCEKISEKLKGKTRGPFSVEHRKNISIGAKGRKSVPVQGDETRRRRSESMKAVWKAKREREMTHGKR